MSDQGGPITPDHDDQAVSGDAENAQDATEPGGAGDTPDAAEDAPAEPAGREAARYRRQLREVEAERDTLRDRLTALQRSAVERLAAEQQVVRPGAIWNAGTQLAELLDDGGQVDPAKASVAITSAIDSLGLAVRTRPKPDPSQGARGGGSSGWSQLLSDPRRS